MATVRLSMIEARAGDIEAAFERWLHEKQKMFIDEVVRVVSVSAPMPTLQGFAITIVYERAARVGSVRRNTPR